MKKLIPILLIVTLLFSSCAKLPDGKEYTSVFSAPYKARITVTDDKREYKAELTLTADGSLTVRFTEPLPLSEIGYVFEGDQCSILYNDTSLPVNAPDADIVSHGVSVWRRLLSPAEEYSVSRSGTGEDKRIILKAKDVEYVFSEADKRPLTVITPTTEIIFTEFNFEDIPEGLG